MTFGNPEQIQQVIQQMLISDQPRAVNRARTLMLFNGDPPYTEQEARDNRIATNINFLEGTRLISQARSQWSNAFLKPGNFFKVNIDTGPRIKRQEWSAIITKNINRMMKRSAKYYHTLEASGANFVLHGPAPVTWIRSEDWCPTAKGVEELLVPSNTLTDLSNLNYFSLYTAFTAKDLFGFIKNPKAARTAGWNVPLIKRALKNMTKIDQFSGDQTEYDWQYPEKAAELMKANEGYWGADSTPTLVCYDFYYLDEEAKNGPSYKRRIVVSQISEAMLDFKSKGEFLFDSGDRSYGEDSSRMLHVLVGDGSIKAPFKYYSTRSLGYLEYALCHLQNRIRCKFTDAAFESMLWYFRNVSSGDMERLEKVDLHHLGIIPEGLSWVPQQERHQTDWGMLNGILSQNRQLMAESSSSFTRDMNDGTDKEMTATETMARVNNSSALLGAMMTRSYTYMTYQYLEIGRRFCTSGSPDCVKFRKQCMEDGVSKEAFDIDAWDIEPERIMGNGNKTLEMASATQMMGIRPLLNPEGQQEVLRDFILANSDDPKKATRLVPFEKNPITSAVEIATLSWGTLIDGQPVAIADSVNKAEYIQTLLQMLNAELGAAQQLAQQTGELPDQRRLGGLMNVVQNIAMQVQAISGDESNKEQVKGFEAALKQAQSVLQQFATALQQQQAQQAQSEGKMTEAQMKAQQIAAMGELQRSEKAKDGDLKRQQKEIDFIQKQERLNEGTAAQIERLNAQTATLLQNQQIAAQGKVVIDAVAEARKPVKPEPVLR